MPVVAERSFLRPRALRVPLQSRELLFPLLDVSSAQAAGVSPLLGGVQLKWTPELQPRMCDRASPVLSTAIAGSNREQLCLA
jgi:hypothetical protein